jgi:hypothetical protein
MIDKTKHNMKSYNRTEPQVSPSVSLGAGLRRMFVPGNAGLSLTTFEKAEM